MLAATLPACGGPGPTTLPAATPTTSVPPVTVPPTPTRLSDLSASVTSPQSDASINCRDEVVARVSLVNNGGTDVAVRGVRNRACAPRAGEWRP